MAEDDVDDLLEEAFKNVDEAEKNGKKMDDVIMKKAKDAGVKTHSEKGRRRSTSRSGSKDKDKERKRKRSRSHDKKKSDSSRGHRRRSPSPAADDKRRSRRGSRERRRRSRSRSRDRKKRSPPRRASRSRSPLDRDAGRRRSPAARRLPGPERRDVLDSLSMPFTPQKSPPRDAKMDMTSEERDERTIFILQLARQTRPRDLEEFFSSVGHVRDVRIITDTKTRRSKGIAYVEFWERDAVPLAMGLSGQKLNGAPLIIQMTCAERNRAAHAIASGSTIGIGLGLSSGPLKLKVVNLHPNITDDMLAAIFEPFGRVDRCYVQKDPMDLSNNTGFVTFKHAEEGRRAMEQLNGFELAGRNIRVSTMETENDQPPVIKAEDSVPQGNLEAEDKNINSSSRLQLMANLAKGRSDVEVPKVTQEAIAAQQAHQQNADNIPSFATQCFMLANMFELSSETEPGWDIDIRDDVIEECKSHGGCVHVFVDKASPQGNVYVKCPTVAVAHKSVVALHGRWFAGKVITANYVPVAAYHELFPDSRIASTILQPRPT